MHAPSDSRYSDTNYSDSHCSDTRCFDVVRVDRAGVVSDRVVSVHDIGAGRVNRNGSDIYVGITLAEIYENTMTEPYTSVVGQKVGGGGSCNVPTDTVNF